MDGLMVFLSFLFLVAPGVFLLLASTAYQDWWEKELDKLNNKWIKNHGNTTSQILGAILAAIGMILVTVGLFKTSKPPKKKYDLRKRKEVVIEIKRKEPGRKVRKTKDGKKYILKYQKGRRKYKRVYL
jgi:multisubunit Na+/H+ antiporter MnhG subunit